MTTLTAELVPVQSSHTPTPDTIAQVERMSAYGISPTSIASIFGITAQEFTFYYSRAFDRGLPKVITAVADAMVHRAIDGDVRAGALFLRTRGGWSEQSKVSVEASVGSLPDTERQKIADAIVERMATVVAGRSDNEVPVR